MAKPKVYYVLCTTSGEEGDPQYAVITLTIALIRWILTRMELATVLKAADGQFYGLTYFECSADYFDRNPSNADEDQDTQSGDFVTLLRAPRGAQAISTAADTIVITNDTVCWHASHKHSGGEFETDTLHIDVLREYLRQLEAPAKPA